MAVVLGTNAGFVTTAPTANPDGASTNVGADDKMMALKDTSAGDVVKVTEIGWYCHNATEAANFEVAIYTHNSGDDNPEAIVVAKSATNAKGTNAGWKVVSGLDIAISTSTNYWIAFQLDDTATTTTTHSGGSGKRDFTLSSATLPDPWGVSGGTSATLFPIYAKVEVSTPVSATDNMTIIGENVY